MPITYNGIGTRYWGRSNEHSRPGTCKHCGRPVDLVSYDTRLWFVVLFIPIIPLGRKRITDMCLACRRHYVADWQKWETAKQLEISGALEKYRTDQSPETAIATHRVLLAYRQTAEAEKFQTLVAAKFNDNARLQAHLGMAMTEFGKARLAEPFFARALELRPDMPEARIGMAECHIHAGRIDEARRLLDFLEKPGASQLYSLAPLERLALACQKEGRNVQAMELFTRLLQELPAIGQHGGFRKEVRRSEEALGSATSILPKAKFSLKRLFQGREVSGGDTVRLRSLFFVVGGAAVLIAIGLGISNEYIRRHRTLYVANALGGELQLDLTGIGPVKLRHGITKVALPEGHYGAKLTGATQESLSLDIQCGYFRRWGDKQAWVLNPGGAAILYLERATYSANPRPPTFSYHFGKSFEQFAEVTHPFTDLPQELSVSSDSDERTLTRLDWFKGAPMDAFYALKELKHRDDALRLAEWDLARNPDDKKMLLAYGQDLDTPAAESRGEAFLRSGLSNRPVRVEWHRTYQELRRDRDGIGAVDKEYGQMLAADPTNSALLYLRGRVRGDPAESMELFERSRRADPGNPYPIYAMAYDLSCDGKWGEARPLLDQAMELRPGDEQFREHWKLICLGLGDFPALEDACRKKLKQDPTDFRSVMNLCEALAIEGKRAEGDQVIKEMASALRSRSPDSADEVATIARERYLYALGDFAGLESEARADRRPDTSKTMLFWSLIEQNRLDEAARVCPAGDVKDPTTLLGASLAWRMAGKGSEVDQWQAPLLKEFAAGGGDAARAAAILDGTTPTTEAALDKIKLAPPMKAALLANLAILHPDMRESLNAEARRLNVQPAFPYHLVRKATAVSPQK
jgi:tetratricopeptide (TPR) repeat protein